MPARMMLRYCAVLIAMVVAGCTPQFVNGWDYRNGPDPEMPYAKRVKPHLKNQIEIMDGLQAQCRRQRHKNDDRDIWYYAAIERLQFRRLRM